MFPDHSLVLYKSHPAIVQGTTDRIEILLRDGEEVRVRPKDIVLLHPGPLKGFSELAEPTGEIGEAWEILTGADGEAGAPTTLKDLAELGFGGFTPATAWAAWQSVSQGHYFEGEPDRIVPLSRAEVERRDATRKAEATEKEARSRFLERARARKVVPEDARFIREIEEVALGRAPRSRLLKELERPESPEGAHALLLELGAWGTGVNPHPSRLRAETALSAIAFHPEPTVAARRDLTGMEAFAIDDEGTTTPDDAVSFDGESLWVHVADPAGFFPIDSALETDARRRAETLHLPEGYVHMFPKDLIESLGLGNQETSPALSARLAIDAEGNALLREIVASTVRVRRLSYGAAEERMGEEPFTSIMAVANEFRRARDARGAFILELPEAHIGVSSDGRVSIEPLGRPTSRGMVQEAMVMTGQAVARWAAERGLSLPYSQQEGSSTVAELKRPAPLSQLWAARRTLRRANRSVSPGKHAGLGVEPYCQTTSPLRRYMDLLVHYQLHAELEGRPPLTSSEVTRRIGEAEAVIPALRQAEILSERHWTLVYLLQNPDWSGDAVVVDQRGRNLVVVVGSLALEAEVHTRKPVEPDGTVKLKVQEVRLPTLEVYFSAL